MVDWLIAFSLFSIGILGYALSNGVLVKCVISIEIIFLSAIYVFINSAANFGANTGTVFALFLIIVSIVDVCVYIFLQDEQNIEKIDNNGEN